MHKIEELKQLNDQLEVAIRLHGIDSDEAQRIMGTMDAVWCTMSEHDRETVELSGFFLEGDTQWSP